MKETRIMKVFEQYIKKYDMNKGNVKAMYFHSLKMMELCKDIASNIGIYNEEEIIVCGLIGLFHNIAMFSNKIKNCIITDENSTKPKETIELLFGKENLMRKITDNTQYDEIIKIAIYCQYKIGLPQGFDEKTKNYCMIIKDANAIERFRMITNYPYMDMHIDNYPNDIIYENFKKFKITSIKANETNGITELNDADKILEVMSYIFGVYYNYSYTILKEESSVNKLLEVLKIKDKGINKFFHEIASVLNIYIERKINS